ncbi:hypothetical protein BK126_04385 [Paenibacillus sp. FSL H7-0326]|uniref:glycoside hydrolase family 113 n=1 Tax=Paenibacillus sp. FSL H7-0326 TaxID=1921144 RepID=UPI00096C8EEA|nr:hypothetical protein [Paenibacillus sp. FSL H7-0326]OMC71340.1 hypothetical protein BK126_04385 [Paenibacillus sp. FSL H7-0326]
MDDTVSSLYGETNLKIKTSSVTIAHTVPVAGEQRYDNLQWFGKVFDRLKAQGLGATIVTSHNLDSATGHSFTHHTKEQIQAILNIAKSKGVPLQMIKPHIMLEWGDGFNRATYQPANPSTFFSKWKEELLFIADIAVSNKIEWLCISCEQYQLTTVEPYYQEWADIVNTLKLRYPNLKLTIACTGQEMRESMTKKRNDVRNYFSVFDLVDAIGANIYGSYTWETCENVGESVNIPVEDIEKALYRDSQGYNYVRMLSDTFQVWKKPVIITEFGCMSKKDGLIRLHATGPTNYDVHALLFQAFFDTIMPIHFVQGFAIWHVYAPFQYFDYEGETVYPGEAVIIEYTQRGLI